MSIKKKRQSLALLIGLSLPTACLAQANAGSAGAPPPKYELSVGVGALKVEQDTKYRPSWEVGLAANAFNRPRLPLVFEYVGAYFSDTSPSISSKGSMEYIGGGFRFGGRGTDGAGGGLFGGATAGFASIVNNTYYQNQLVSSGKTNKGSLSFFAGVNIPAGEKWGFRISGRGIKIAEYNPWLGQFSFGIYGTF
jgi:hypothetical protein